MNTRRYSFSALSSLAVALLISGCGAGVVNSVTTPTKVTSPVTPQATGTMVNDFGGHAPLVGAHIYMVQLGAPAAQVTAGNSPQTYGSVVKSLFTTNGQFSGQYPLGTGAGDQFVPATDLVGQPFKYVTTDQYGQAFFTGDYTCDPGYPVMLVGYGGAPSYVGSGPNAFRVTNVNVVSTGANTATFTFTTGVAGTMSGTPAAPVFTPTTGGVTSQLFYPGELVTFNGFQSGGNVNTTFNNNFSGTTYTVSSTGLTTNSFQITYTTNTGGAIPAGNYPQPGGFVVGTPTGNPAATNLAVLGNCPSTGVPNFGPTSTAPISFIYMNEVSTTAAAYALAGFTNTNATSQTGYDEFHIGAPVGNLVGIQNAAVTAGLLYDITGASGTGTTPGNGESHVARTATPNGGNGVVPQQLINTIANALAACVDSNNTFRQNTGVYSTACLLLHQFATDNGVFDKTGQVGSTVPIRTGANTTYWSFNIAQAAFNLARHPQGAGTGTTANPTATNNAADGNTYYYGGTQTVTAGTATTAAALVSAIVTLPAGTNTPFGPNYTSGTGINDLAIGINWSDAGANGGTAKAIGEIASDASGNIWIAQNTGAYQLSPSGAYTVYTSKSGSSASGTNPGLTIGPTGTVYESATAGFQSFTPGLPTGLTAVGTGAGGIDLSTDGTYVYQATNPGALNASFNKYTLTGTQTSPYPIAGAVPFPFFTDGAANCAYQGANMTPDMAGNVWTSSSGTFFITLFGFTNQVCKLNSSGALVSAVQLFTSFNQTPRNLAIDNGNGAWFADSSNNSVSRVTSGGTMTKATTGTLSTPVGVAVDGANTTWVANSGNGSVTQYSNGVAALTPTYLQSDGAAPNDLTFLAIDPSGNVWAAGTSEGKVLQLVGAAAPTTTPISLATANKTLGVMAGLTSSAVTAYTISGNVVTFTGANSFYVGEQVSLGQFTTATYFNGLTLTITARTATTFTASYTHANASSTTDPGLASAQN